MRTQNREQDNNKRNEREKIDYKLRDNKGSRRERRKSKLNITRRKTETKISVSSKTRAENEKDRTKEAEERMTQKGKRKQRKWGDETKRNRSITRLKEKGKVKILDVIKMQ